MQNLERVGEFNDVQIYCRCGELSAGMRARLVQFWLGNGAIADIHQCWQRTFDVGCIALDSRADIVGVSSIYVDRLNDAGSTYWFYRMFVRPDSRMPGLSKTIFLTTFAHLAQLYGAERGAPAGMVVVAENPKFDRPGAQRSLRAIGLESLGIDRHGKSVWRRNFPL